MTARVRSLTVMFDEDIREDDVEAYVQAISLMRGVASVEKGPVADMNAIFARNDARRALGNMLWEFLYPSSSLGKPSQ